MMIKKVRIILNSVFILALLGYILYLLITREPVGFILSLPVALAIGLLVCLLNVILFGIIHRREPQTLLAGAGALLIFLVGGWILNRYGFPNKFHPISILGNLGLLSFAVFFGWSIRTSGRKHFVGVGTAFFAFFIGLLLVVPSITHQQAESSDMEELKSLPYLTWVDAEEPTRSEVTQYAHQKAFPGVNIYTPRNRARAYLIDMEGKVLHTWRGSRRKSLTWQHIQMAENGDLLAIVKDRMLLRLDWDSKLKWSVRGRFHHDVTIADNGDVYALIRKGELEFMSGIPVPILNDFIVILAPDGTIQREISLFKIIKQHLPPEQIEHIYRWILDLKRWRETMKQKGEHEQNGRKMVLETDTIFDILHNNTLTLIDQDVPGVCKKGNILISVRQLDLIGIADLEQEQLVWSWGPGVLSRQHHPTMLENGNILIFDNGMREKRSRILELDPRTNTIVWEYQADPPEAFFSGSRGASQRLPNGNTLITDSNRGYVFEVTPTGDIVWEFYNPEVKGTYRAAIYRMIRITDPEQYPKLQALLY